VLMDSEPVTDEFDNERQRCSTKTAIIKDLEAKSL
jgi:hypothetical protein